MSEQDALAAHQTQKREVPMSSLKNRKPRKIRSDVDDVTLAVIEHLTGERLQRRSPYSEALPSLLMTLAAVTTILVAVPAIIV